ncbi:Ger(x)C family spore germination protein [Neobacillus niacini]|jgi:spore germination protein KC|uniref:Ger(x)C family spore germination protein n=1 Tax=Neobacillus niacini TaxID=86668 RepID=UPI001C8E12D4|nr:Ger(x)C family spore germination protein [Neobacillus niacini]MBY0146933.1 Ger(x)C family spore germination protein [Neobacillus niacini]
MPKTKTVCRIVLFFVVVMFLTGCWDRGELEDKSYVIGLGLDLSKQEGKIKVTMLLANPEVGSLQGGGGSTEKAREIISFDANDFIAAKATANSVISRSISYELLRIFVVSEEFARDPNFTTTFFEVLKDKEIRLNSYLAISKEKAAEYFLKNKPRMETRPHKYFQFMVDHGIENGLIPDSTLFRYFQSAERETDLFLAMYTTAKRLDNPRIQREDEYMAGELNATGELDDTQFIGSAVFKKGIMISKLTGQETRTVNILDDTTNIKDILVNLPDPFADDDKKQIAARIMKTKGNKIKMKLKGVRPQIYITIPLQLEIMSNPSKANYALEKNRQKLRKHIADHIEKMNEDLLKKSQTKLKGVPYPLPLYAKKYFSTIQEYKKFNWAKSYLRADIHVKAEIEIVDYGKETNRPIKVGH